MWYVIQTIGGKEHEVCMWINTYVDKSFFQRCFVPLYEDVWRKNGIGHICIKRMFSGYLFLETDTPEKMHDALKGISELTVILSAEDKDERSFIPLHKEEEVFFDSILSDGLMKVSYVNINRIGKIVSVIGPLQSYQDNIVRVDIPHRRAIVDVPILGENKRLKFCLWLDADPKIPWIEEEKKNRMQERDGENANMKDPWDWKVWKKINSQKKNGVEEDTVYGYKVGEYVINTTGIYGDMPLEIAEIRPGKNSIVVNVMMFGSMTRVEMGMDEVEKKEA